MKLLAARADQPTVTTTTSQTTQTTASLTTTQSTATSVATTATTLLLLEHLDKNVLYHNLGDEDHHLTQGIRLVQQDLVAALGRVGIESFSPKGEAFDPNQHEAISQQPVEGAQPGTVVDVYQQGYRLAGNVIRPARVVVAA